MTSPTGLLAVATEAAQAAAAILAESFGGPRVGVGAKSTPTDLVSDADRQAEEAIGAVLARRRPDDAVLGEEEADRSGTSGLRWIIDPLDGTVNFLFGIPQWAVSVACEDEDGALAGVVLDPLRGETFAATRDGPATRNGEHIHGSRRDDLASAMVATGFAYDADVREQQARTVSRVLPRARDIRRLGSAALDMTWTACGRFDAYYERGLQPWDRAAAALICARAGLSLHELEPREGLPSGLVVAPSGLMGELRALVE